MCKIKLIQYTKYSFYLCHLCSYISADFKCFIIKKSNLSKRVIKTWPRTMKKVSTKQSLGLKILTIPPPPTVKILLYSVGQPIFPIYYRKESVEEIGIKSVECVTYRANVL